MLTLLGQTQEVEVNGVSLLGNDGMDNDEYGEFVRIVSDVPATAPTT